MDFLQFIKFLFSTGILVLFIDFVFVILYFNFESPKPSKIAYIILFILIIRFLLSTLLYITKTF